MTACTNTPTDYPGPYGEGQPFAGQPVKILIDTDPGIDDAMAVLYAALAPEVDLVGLTTVYGNVSIEVATPCGWWNWRGWTFLSRKVPPGHWCCP